MNLTPQQLREYADAIEAHEAGKPVQYLNNGVWTLSEYPPRMWNFDMHYRPAPEPEPPKPWDCAADLAELGPVIWITGKDETITCSLVIGISENGVEMLWGRNQIATFTWADMATAKYSTDRKEWKPCHKAP
jgi:hypothetical protein